MGPSVLVLLLMPMLVAACATASPASSALPQLKNQEQDPTCHPKVRNPPPGRTVFLRANLPQLKRIAGADPAYTFGARVEGVKGLVIVIFTITSRGDVACVRILKNLPILGPVCQEAVRRWKFRPIVYEGQPVNVIVKQP